MAWRPHWRKMTWVVVIFNILMLIWLIAGVGGAADSQFKECASIIDETERAACEAGTAIGAGLGAGIIIFLWVAGDIILGIVWLVTRPKRRTCPACGSEVRKGLTICPSCGHDFARAAGGGPAIPT